eukprot:SAG22_NODE_758_length_7435_cov_25.653899_3_plen_58_part_01
MKKNILGQIEWGAEVLHSLLLARSGRPAFQNRLVGDIESFSKGLKKAGRAFKKGGDRV